MKHSMNRALAPSPQLGVDKSPSPGNCQTTGERVAAHLVASVAAVLMLAASQLVHSQVVPQQGLAAVEPLVGAPVKRVVAQPGSTVPTQIASSQPTRTLPKFVVSRADENFRVVLQRWTKDAGWEFEPEHWGVARDIPVSGHAEFGSDFKAAVRAFLKSSEFADMPVHPCFYSNKVLRVVPRNEVCQRDSAS